MLLTLSHYTAISLFTLQAFNPGRTQPRATSIPTLGWHLVFNPVFNPASFHTCLLQNHNSQLCFQPGAIVSTRVENLNSSPKQGWVQPMLKSILGLTRGWSRVEFFPVWIAANFNPASTLSWDLSGEKRCLLLFLALVSCMRCQFHYAKYHVHYAICEKTRSGKEKSLLHM